MAYPGGPPGGYPNQPPGSYPSAPPVPGPPGYNPPVGFQPPAQAPGIPQPYPMGQQSYPGGAAVPPPPPGAHMAPVPSSSVHS